MLTSEKIIPVGKYSVVHKFRVLTVSHSRHFLYRFPPRMRNTRARYLAEVVPCKHDMDLIPHRNPRFPHMVEGNSFCGIAQRMITASYRVNEENEVCDTRMFIRYRKVSNSVNGQRSENIIYRHSLF